MLLVDVLKDDLQVEQVVRLQHTQLDQARIAQTQIKLFDVFTTEDIEDGLVSGALSNLGNDPENDWPSLEDIVWGEGWLSMHHAIPLRPLQEENNIEFDHWVLQRL